MKFLWLAAIIIAVVGGVVLFARRRPNFDTTPDRPISFGWKIYWLAFPCDDLDQACSALARADRRFAKSEFVPANWASGFDRIFSSILRKEVFVTPPVNGWTLVVNWPVPNPENVEGFKSVLEPLSAEFGRAAAFGSHRVVSLVAWALAEDGELKRCFYQADFETYVDFGEKPPEEVALNLLTPGELEQVEDAGDDEYDRVAGESEVIQLAAAWTVDPTALEQEHDLTTGRWALGKG